MRIEIEIPKEFEEHFNQDKFEDSLHRLSTDAHLIAGNYEKETAIMLIKAFKESKPAYDTEKVVAELQQQANQYNRRSLELVEKSTEAGIHNKGKACSYEHAIEIVRKGGTE